MKKPNKSPQLKQLPSEEPYFTTNIPYTPITSRNTLKVLMKPERISSHDTTTSIRKSLFKTTNIPHAQHEVIGASQSVKLTKDGSQKENKTETCCGALRAVHIAASKDKIL